MNSGLPPFTRRKFLQYMGMGALSAFFPHDVPDQPLAFSDGPSGDTPLGRVCSNQAFIHKEPDKESPQVTFMRFDDIFRLPETITALDYQKKTRHWYKLAENRYLDAALVQPVFNRPNNPEGKIYPWGILGEITVPLTHIYTWPLIGWTARKVYFSNTFWVLRRVFDEKGDAWYELMDDYDGNSFFVAASAVRLVPLEELKALSPEVPPDQKRLEVNLGEQRVRAFEYGRQVFDTLVSTGAGKGLTPTGTFASSRKRPCRHMVNELAGGQRTYDLLGVPWVSYIDTNGVAFHGAYWHSNWGNTMSSGCINMRPEDAKWIYLWSDPNVPFNAYQYQQPAGTRVDVIE